MEHFLYFIYLFTYSGKDKWGGRFRAESSVFTHPFIVLYWCPNKSFYYD